MKLLETGASVSDMCMLVESSATDRVPAEAGEVWQQRILISRTAGEKAFASVDILRMCGSRGRWQRAKLRYPEFAGDDVEVRCPLPPRPWSAVITPLPSNLARVANDGRETD